MTELVLKDRVKETSTTVGTDFFTLLGADVGYQSFSVIGNGNICYYTIQNTASGYEGEWEVGIGTYFSPNQLIRNTVLSSSNSGSLVSFSAGTKSVFVTYPAEKSVSLAAATQAFIEASIPFSTTGGHLTNSLLFQYQALQNQAVAPVFYSTNGIMVHSKFISQSYTIPYNSTAYSYGPITITNGVSLTIPSGQNWAVFSQL